MSQHAPRFDVIAVLARMVVLDALTERGEGVKR